MRRINLVAVPYLEGMCVMNQLDSVMTCLHWDMAYSETDAEKAGLIQDYAYLHRYAMDVVDHGTLAMDYRTSCGENAETLLMAYDRTAFEIILKHAPNPAEVSVADSNAPENRIRNALLGYDTIIILAHVGQLCEWALYTDKGQTMETELEEMGLSPMRWADRRYRDCHNYRFQHIKRLLNDQGQYYKDFVNLCEAMGYQGAISQIYNLGEVTEPDHIGILTLDECYSEKKSLLNLLNPYWEN